MTITNCKAVYIVPKKYMETFGNLHHTVTGSNSKTQNSPPSNATMLTAAKLYLNKAKF